MQKWLILGKDTMINLAHLREINFKETVEGVPLRFHFSNDRILPILCYSLEEANELFEKIVEFISDKNQNILSI